MEANDNMTQEQREEEIRQVEGEVEQLEMEIAKREAKLRQHNEDVIRHGVEYPATRYYTRSLTRFCRILAREQAVLADLKKGTRQ